MEKFINNAALKMTSTLISPEKYKTIVSFLKDQTIKINHNLKHQILKKGYLLKDLPGMDLTNVLVIPHDQEFLRVIPTDRLYALLEQIHVNQFKHAGYKKIMHYVRKYIF